MTSVSQLGLAAVEPRQQASLTARGMGRMYYSRTAGSSAELRNSGESRYNADQMEGRFQLQNVNGFTVEKAEEIFRFLRDDSNGGWLIVLLTEINVD